MKKIIIIIVALMAVVGMLSACEIELGGAGQDEITDLEAEIADLKEQLAAYESEDDGAKEEDKNNDVESDADEEDDADEKNDADEKSDADEEDEDEPEDQYDGPSFLQLNSPDSNEHFDEQPITFTGKVSPNTTKIVITANYIDSETGGDEEDVYKLQNFEYGDESFTYKAHFDYDNLGYGENQYVIKSYFDDGSTETETIILFYSDTIQ